MLEILERIVDGKGEMSDLDELEELAHIGTEYGSVRSGKKCASSGHQYPEPVPRRIR